MLSTGYLLNEPGNYTFVIKLYGHHIKGSPFKLRCLSSATSAGDFSKDTNGVKGSSSSSSSPAKSGAVRQRAVRRPLSANFADQRKSLLADAVEDDLVLRVGARGRGNKAAEFSNPQVGYLVTFSFSVSFSFMEEMKMQHDSKFDLGCFKTRNVIPAVMKKKKTLQIHQSLQ